MSDDANREVVHTIPQCYKDLVMETAKLFYGPEELEYNITRILVYFDCLEKHDLGRKLEIDLPTLQSTLSNLKYDRLVTERLLSEIDANDTRKEFPCFSINFKSLTDVVKWKLDRIREVLKKKTVSLTQPFFICSNTNCKMTFDELDSGELFYPAKNGFYCTYCKEPVVENTASIEQNDETSIADFNTRTAHLYDLLKECDMYKLDAKLLQPEPYQGERETTVVLED